MPSKPKTAYGDVNFTLKGGLAYTEDSVLVLNIVAFKIPSKIDQNELKKHFIKFGETKDFKYFTVKKRGKKQKSLKIAFINFKEPLSATKALANRIHLLNGKKIHVKACDSWHQPSSKSENENYDMISVDGIGFNNEAKLFSLNDDCLTNILNMLNLKDQIRFAYVCERFLNIFTVLAKSKYKILDLNKILMEDLTLMEMRKFIQCTGRYIEGFVYYSITIPNDLHRIFELIVKYCRNLVTITICKVKTHVRFLKKLFKNARKVKILTLIDCSLIEIALLPIAKLPHLESLNISSNSKLLGEHLPKFHKLKHLDLDYCSSITSENFIKFCDTYPQVISLDIQHCTRLNDAAFTTMQLKCKKLTTLKISTTTSQYDCIAQIENLKHLIVLKLQTPIHNHLFEELAIHKSEQLETLEIHAKDWLTATVACQICELKNLKTLCCKDNIFLTDELLLKFSQLKELTSLDMSACPNFTSKGLLNFLKDRPQLKLVNINLCGQITNDFVFKAIDLLKEQKDRTVPCKFFVAKTNVADFVSNTPVYIENKSILTIDFKIDDNYCFILTDEDFVDDDFGEDFDLEPSDVDDDDVDDNFDLDFDENSDFEDWY